MSRSHRRSREDDVLPTLSFWLHIDTFTFFLETLLVLQLTHSALRIFNMLERRTKYLSH